MKSWWKCPVCKKMLRDPWPDEVIEHRWTHRNALIIEKEKKKRNVRPKK